MRQYLCSKAGSIVARLSSRARRVISGQDGQRTPCAPPMCRRADHPQLPESKEGAVKDMAHAAQDVAREQTDLQRSIQDAVEEVLPVYK